MKILQASGLRLQPSRYRTLQVADEGTSTIEGEVQVPFDVGGVTRLVPVLYAPRLSCPLLLGLDFWRRYNLRPDFLSSTVHIAGATVEIIDPPPETEIAITDEQKKRLEVLLQEFRPLLSPGKLGTVKGVQHTINVGDAKPFKTTYYSVNPKVMAEVHAELQRRLDNDIVEPADSPFQSPLLIIPKKNKGLRWVVDFRKLNSLIQEPDSSYPLPKINPMITKLGGATILSTIDISDAYLQIELAPESRPCTAFYVPGRGQFQFKRMPAGLKDAASRWQRTIETVLDSLYKLITINPNLPLSWVPVVPRELRHQLLEECHDIPTSGHGGWWRTFQRLRSKGYWPQMIPEIKKYVQECHVCQRVKKDRRRPPGFMGSKIVVSRPIEFLSADLIGPLPRTRKGYTYISVITDSFSKYTFIRPLRKASASAVCDHFEEDVILKHGAPRLLQVDNGQQYVSHLFKALCGKYNIKLRYNIPYTPRNNPTERMNQTLETLICSYIQDDHRTWDEHLPSLQAALNTSTSFVTGISPHQVLFGQDLILDGRNRLFDGCSDPDVEEVDEADLEQKQEMKLELYEEIKKRLQAAKKLNAHRYNLRRRQAEFTTGDMVWRRNFVKSDKADYFSKKLAPTWTGPFKVK
ncbi:hypothetical protein FOCC_FOCC016181, partial [Frankliniella occidentalis]